MTYNSEMEIGPCLDSLQSNLIEGICEVIIIDNGSKDGTLDEIYARKMGHFYLIESGKNIGFTKAVNRGIDKSVGEFVLLLNPDTQVKANTIFALAQKLSSTPKISAIAPQLKFLDGRIQYSCRRFPTHWNVFREMVRLNIFSSIGGWKMIDFNHTTEREVDQAAGAALMVRQSVLNELDRLDEGFPMFFSDVDLCKRIKDAGGEIRFCPDITVTHIGGSTIIKHRSAMIITSHLSMIRYFLKHYKGLNYIIPNILMTILLLLGIPLRLLTISIISKNQLERQAL